MSDDSSSGTRLRVSVVDARGRSLRQQALARWLAHAAPRSARGAVTIALVSDRRIRDLNRRYRGVDRATDVLSFPANTSHGAMRGPRPDPPHLGDIAIATGVSRRQARRARHTPDTEQRILALHGLLHLLGYDHDADDGRMERAEQRLRKRSGLPAGLIEREARA